MVWFVPIYLLVEFFVFYDKWLLQLFFAQITRFWITPPLGYGVQWLSSLSVLSKMRRTCRPRGGVAWYHNAAPLICSPTFSMQFTFVPFFFNCLRLILPRSSSPLHYHRPSSACPVSHIEETSIYQTSRLCFATFPSKTQIDCVATLRITTLAFCFFPSRPALLPL